MKITQRLLERKYFIIAFFWTGLITWLSLVSFENIPKVSVSIPGKDKIIHFVFYFVFVFLWTKALNIQKWKQQIIMVLSAIFYGIIIEIFQDVFTLTRNADIFDIVANTFGAIIGCLFVRIKKLIV